jgi:aminoglycoside phosphotransferase (APT) family kinase protein
MGQPEQGYPWQWSVYEWLDGEHATLERINDLNTFALDLADFLLALQRIDTSNAPRAGSNSFRGGSLKIWDEQARSAIAVLRGKIDTDTATAIWDAALQAPFTAEPVWYHGDVAAGNLLVRDGRLCAVIDSGGLAVGDPACDLAIAWTLLDAPSRALFRTRLDVDDAIWTRGRGWVLWKGMIILAGLIETNVIEAASAERAVAAVLKDRLAFSFLSPRAD